MTMREQNPALWADLVAAVREIVGDWSEDDIATVIRKIRAPSPEQMLGHIACVLAWCAAAQRSDDEEAKACVDLWKMDLPIEIFVDSEGRVSHRLDPDVEVTLE